MKGISSMFHFGINLSSLQNNVRRDYYHDASKGYSDQLFYFELRLNVLKFSKDLGLECFCELRKQGVLRKINSRPITFIVIEWFSIECH